MGELRGVPTRASLSAAAADPGTGREPWGISEGLTGVGFPATAR